MTGRCEGAALCLGYVTCAPLQIYDEDELLHAKLDILSKTNMIDYTIDIRKQLYPNVEVPEVRFTV